jgi:endonuclease/exonuclease/phosphatase family metal-dependent hydrolase
MRLLSYNILDGGEGRADPLAEVILAQKPDVVVLIEADNPDVVQRIARRLNMDVICGQGREHTAAILSRWPIETSINHAAVRPAAPCLLEAAIRLPGGVFWTIAAAHLHPRAFEADERQREMELAEVLDVLADHRRAGRPHILAGDFNANSPIQRIDPGQCKEKTRQAWQANGGQIPRRVIQRLLDSGYVDALHAVHGPAAGTMTTFTTQYPGQRLDYIFTHGIDRNRIAQAWIEQDRLAKYASDHFPIGAEIR